MSEETATLLLEADKGHWVAQRDDTVYAKGKGGKYPFGRVRRCRRATILIMYRWCRNDHVIFSNGESKTDSSSMSVVDAVSKNEARLIDWNVGVLRRLLQHIVARRKARGRESQGHTLTYLPADQGNVIDEVQEVIDLPAFDSAANGGQSVDYIMLEMPETVETQLHLFVSSLTIQGSRMYNLSKRAPLRPNLRTIRVLPSRKGKSARDLRRNLYQLILISLLSVDLCWEMPMDDTFADLRACIYGNELELTGFRQLVVNSVMATDILDKDLKALRNARWDAAFSEQCSTIATDLDRNRKATIVIEHLIQSSDVAHTMQERSQIYPKRPFLFRAPTYPLFTPVLFTQHRHVYRKWNAKLFQERYKAWKEGHSEKNPSEFWYRGELGFFDFYIIPLAKKLKDCGVFGVSSDEYLKYAENNRKEWEMRGEQVVEELIEMVKGDS
eukprot:scaffold4278_cov173-Amphora_coffeaeformis.AAC.11